MLYLLQNVQWTLGEGGGEGGQQWSNLENRID